MNLRCLLGHKWEYYMEEITYRSSAHVYPPKEITLPTKVRCCSRCYKKQKCNIGEWTSWYLTKQEERDKKLKEIGI